MSSCLTFHFFPVPEGLVPGPNISMTEALKAPLAPPFSFPRSRGKEESLAWVAIETNSLQLYCEVVRTGHASLTQARAGHFPPHQTLSDQVTLQNSKDPRVLPCVSLVFLRRGCVTVLCPQEIPREHPGVSFLHWH